MTEERRQEINAERIATLNDEFQGIVLEVFEILESDGWRPYIVQAKRSIEQQRAYYAQGRETLEETNRLRKLAGLDSIDAEENSKKVTWTMKSNHLSGNAIDVVSIDTAGQINWDDMNFFKECAEVFAPFDVAWGGKWSKPDYDHYELIT